ncbi:hypothetical protein A1O3_04094 [Capronia epimyces CBS 606.96]|uniref:Forkhead box protein O n=1 Tax=Capronia epimyces CBS 606.96 TaxID=1182542 RepID=W9YCZ8_9EURO|nr:uncharacterized protein A1O3_04094 [Capronia epimyces CBS 606.96]EXJ87136.1 hypothetical protein A1O3_04094 [Capronia epimyces CBS 606.96]
MVKMEADEPPHQLESYNNMVDSDFSNILSVAINQHALHASSSGFTHMPLSQGGVLQDLHPLLKVEGMVDDSLGPAGMCPSHHIPPTTQVQLSDLELGPTWFSQQAYPTLITSGPVLNNEMNGWPMVPCSADIMTPPYSTYHSFEELDSRIPWSSSPEFAHCRPLTSTGEQPEGCNDKPYARLIYEALMQAPGHRMMLRDIYEWFRLNTTKPEESGSNGWQNSIRHNLSMNQAFENDRECSGGNTRKANSVWMLTEDAVKNGVQSTTRYRKTAGGKRTGSNRAAAVQRQRSGAKGGRAARWMARQRRQENPLIADATPSSSPTTPSYSDVSEYQSFDYHGFRPAMTSWPITPVDDSLHLPDDAMQNMCLSPQSSFDLNASQATHADESSPSRGSLLRCLRDRQLQE